MLSKKIPICSRKKLSKAETLREALLYIKYLQEVLAETERTQFCPFATLPISSSSLSSSSSSTDYNFSSTESSSFSTDSQLNNCKTPY
ncbi:unnamed protein product [Enterobius vermicularis]|uniref:BHLH domain-containing protein n=1 Tax=Enterobius vermicularis TaxID=51028 RepID=A0A0N4V5U6_ENTVE|nr:unnamed protein product [Enterobius vermicularis]